MYIPVVLKFSSNRCARIYAFSIIYLTYEEQNDNWESSKMNFSEGIEVAFLFRYFNNFLSCSKSILVGKIILSDRVRLERFNSFPSKNILSFIIYQRRKSTICDSFLTDPMENFNLNLLTSPITMKTDKKQPEATPPRIALFWNGWWWGERDWHRLFSRRSPCSREYPYYEWNFCWGLPLGNSYTILNMIRLSVFVC